MPDAAAKPVLDISATNPQPGDINFYREVTLQFTVEFGRTQMTIKQLLGLAPGNVMEINKTAGDPLDIRINGNQVARGEIVVVNDKYGIRVTEVLTPETLIDEMNNK